MNPPIADLTDPAPLADPTGIWAEVAEFLEQEPAHVAEVVPNAEVVERSLAELAAMPRTAPRKPRPLTPIVGFEPLESRSFGPIHGPFDSLGKCLLAALLGLLAMGGVAVYLMVPSLGVCAQSCHADFRAQLVYDIFSVAVLSISAYFIALYLIGLRGSRERPPASSDLPFFVLVTPAHNEALVIAETARRLLGQDYGRYVAMIMNDDSSDDTGRIAREAGGGDERLIVFDRPPEVAGQGKGEVLNDAYRIVMEMLADDDERLDGAAEEDIVLCVVDADGWLRPDALKVVADYYADPEIAGVQLPVRMYNARKGFLALMQDIEFVGYAILLQGGRDRFGSVLLGGNGQFIRLKALTDLAPKPWTKSLVEDLDIGLSLVQLGWRNRMCGHTCVAQQAVTKPRRLLKQRTRWVQGHYSAWTHLKGLWRARRIPPIIRVDLSLHLLLAVTILVVTIQALLGAMGFLGIITIDGSVVARLAGNGIVFRILVLIMACGPLSMLAVAYQRAAVHYDSARRHRTPLWAMPGVYISFVAYAYFWGVPCTLRAFARLALRRDAWDKTARDAVPVAGGKTP